MPAEATLQDTIKEAAYTSLGVSAIAFEKINAANADLFGQLNKRFDQARKDVNAQVKEGRKNFDKEIKVAKKTAVATTKDLRAKVDPVAEQVEARLPIPFARLVETSRTQAWEFVGATKTAPAKPAAAKKAPVKAAAKKTARKTTAKKTTKASAKK